MRLAELGHVTKGYIVNEIIEKFHLKSYLECNKFDGQNFFDDIVCQEKHLCFIPEKTWLDKENTERLQDAIEKYSPRQIVGFRELKEKFKEKKFDLIMFDPVHIRPDVDETLKALLELLTPDGFLVVHDCNPEDERITSRDRVSGAWVGETYKAFSLFHQYNRSHSLTISEDYGVGLVLNRNLNLDYPINQDLRYRDFSSNRVAYNGLCTYENFHERLNGCDRSAIFTSMEKNHNSSALFHPLFEMKSECVLSQLFWCKAGVSFSEKESLSLPLMLDGRAQLLIFDFPDQVESLIGLRFDFSNAIASAQLEEIGLYDEKNTLIWRWDGQLSTLMLPENMTVMMPQDDCVAGALLIAYSSDPHCNLALPTKTLAQITSGWRMEITLTGLNSVATGWTTSILKKQSTIDEQLAQQEQLNLTLIEQVRMQKEQLALLTAGPSPNKKPSWFSQLWGKLTGATRTAE